MKFVPEITIGDISTIIMIIVILQTYSLSRRAERKLQKATFVRDYTRQFYEDPEITSIFFDIDYNRFTFNKEMLGTEKELRLVKLLDMLNSLSFNYANGIIKTGDIDDTTLGYAISRVYRNPEVKNYLKHVDKHSTNINMKVTAFGYFRQLGEKEIERARRYHNPLSLILFDVDDFKKYNDSYGHVEGDQALEKLGEIIKKNVRIVDTAYRYGGEEFTIILPETGWIEAYFGANRIRRAFEGFM